jgi:hypothetical protein
MKLIAITCLLLATALGGYADTILMIDPSPSSVYVGDTLTLNLDINTDSSVFFYQLDLVFPASILQVTSVTETGYFAANTSGLFEYDMPFDNTDGLVTNILDTISGNTGLTGADTILQFQFQAIAPGSGQVTVQADPNEFPQGMLGDDSFDVINVDTLNAADVTVLATPEPSSLQLAAIAALILAGWAVRSRSARSATNT